jgi:YegS/Rv2252/BmrU family lipid kinase
LNICFVFNPQAGPARDRSKLLRLIEEFLKTTKVTGSVYLTERRGHATELAAAAVAAGANVVVAVGGDGTVNEVAGALVDSTAALGIVPCGSGNGLARHLGISLRPAVALAGLASGRVRRIDAGEANGRLFFCAMGTGFDTAVLTSFERLARRGFAAYFVAAMRAFSSYRCEAYGLRIGAGEVEVRPSLFVTVANSDQLGNNARIAPGARVDDGRLDLVVIPPVGWVSGLPLVGRLFAGSLNGGAGVGRWTGERFVVTRAAAGPIHVDGELVETAAEISVRVRPGCLRVIGPVRND